jgi:hypothetical protein
MVIPFRAPTNSLDVCSIDYALFKILRITNAGAESLSIIDLVVNNEFEPGAALTDTFRLFHYPVPLPPGNSFEFILQPPSTANLPFDCAYPKHPVSLVILTRHSIRHFRADSAVYL